MGALAKGTAKTATVLRAVGVGKAYRMDGFFVHAVRDVNLEIKQGEFVSIMGPSGSGKTTLLDLLSCLSRPSSGEIFIKEKKISKMDDAELAAVRGKTIGFVFQTFNLIGRMSALENVALPLWFQGIPEAEREEIARQRLEQVGLAHRALHRPNEMSGGGKAACRNRARFGRRSRHYCGRRTNREP